jgi:hypothetical protein
VGPDNDELRARVTGSVEEAVGDVRRSQQFGVHARVVSEAPMHLRALTFSDADDPDASGRKSCLSMIGGTVRKTHAGMIVR